MKRKIFVAVSAIVLAAVGRLSAYAAGWEKDNVGWYYSYSDK